MRTLTSLFFLFLVSVIAWANSGHSWIIFELVHRAPYGDKVAHFTLIGTFALLLNLSLRNRSLDLCGCQFVIGTWMVLGLATLEEMSQFFVVSRDCSVGDWVADVLGILFLGGWVARRLLGTLVQSEEDLPS